MIRKDKNEDKKDFIIIRDMDARTEEQFNHKNDLLARAKALGLSQVATEQDVLDVEQGKKHMEGSSLKTGEQNAHI